MKSSVLALLVWISVTIVLAMATGPRRHWSLTSSTPAAEMVTVTLLAQPLAPATAFISAQHSTASFRNTAAAVARTADKVQELGREQEGGAIRRKVESI